MVMFAGGNPGLSNFPWWWKQKDYVPDISGPRNLPPGTNGSMDVPDDFADTLEWAVFNVTSFQELYRDVWLDTFIGILSISIP